MDAIISDLNLHMKLSGRAAALVLASNPTDFIGQSEKIEKYF